jgi:alkylated DNA nucleotide flippase Atl1
MIPPDADMEPTQMRRLAPRWVGTALRKTPHGKSIPWHRVINSQGAISFPAGSAQAKAQRCLLEMDGVCFDQRGKVSFAHVGWRGPPDSYLRRRGLLPPSPLK